MSKLASLQDRLTETKREISTLEQDLAKLQSMMAEKKAAKDAAHVSRDFEQVAKIAGTLLAIKEAMGDIAAQKDAIAEKLPALEAEIAREENFRRAVELAAQCQKGVEDFSDRIRGLQAILGPASEQLLAGWWEWYKAHYDFQRQAGTLRLRPSELVSALEARGVSAGAARVPFAFGDAIEHGFTAVFPWPAEVTEPVRELVKRLIEKSKREH